MPTLTDPIKLHIQKQLCAALEEITVANGYATDLEGRVYRGRLYFGDETPLPFLSVLEVPIPLDQLPSPRDAQMQFGQWELIIQGFVVDDRDNPTDPAHIVLADVKKRLAREQAKANWHRPEDGILGLGRVVDKLYIGVGVVRPPDDISATAYFWLQIALDIAENFAEPYTA